MSMDTYPCCDTLNHFDWKRKKSGYGYLQRRCDLSICACVSRNSRLICLSAYTAYGEAGHEALLPLKTSVYDEIAKGIVRQLSPAKLSGIVDMLRSAVRERNEIVTVQVQERRDLRAAEKATLHEEDSGVEELREEAAVLGSRMEQVLTLLKELLGTSKSGANALLQALLGMRIDLNGEAVGRLIAPEINERLNDLYELEERGRF